MFLLFLITCMCVYLYVGVYTSAVPTEAKGIGFSGVGAVAVSCLPWLLGTGLGSPLRTHS